jgi:hypothetical protein
MIKKYAASMNSANRIHIPKGLPLWLVAARGTMLPSDRLVSDGLPSETR